MALIAFLFPGQGSQYSGMGKELSNSYPEFRYILEEANDTLQLDLSRLCFEGPEEKLRMTAITQPSIMSVSVGIWEIVKRRASLPDFAAGHSLGEYSALVAAGALRFRDAVSTVKLRGEYMQEAVPEGEGAMAAIIGLKAEIVDDVCGEASREGIVSAANYNSPEQTVISGETEAVERAIEVAKKRGAKRALKLQVSAPFHCALMRQAQEKLADHLVHVSFQDCIFPIVTNVDAQVIGEGGIAKDSLIRQVTAPVRWMQTIQLLKEKGVEILVELGPKKILSGLARQTDESFKMFHVEDEASLSETLKGIEST